MFHSVSFLVLFAWIYITHLSLHDWITYLYIFFAMVEKRSILFLLQGSTCFCLIMMFLLLFFVVLFFPCRYSDFYPSCSTMLILLLINSIRFNFHFIFFWVCFSFFFSGLWKIFSFFFLLFSLLSICFHLLNFFIRFLSNQIISVFRNNAQSNRVQSVLSFVSLRKNNLSCSCSLFLVTTNPRMCLFSFYSFCCWLFHLNLIKLVFCLFDCEFHIAHLNLWSKLCPSLSI